ncbi:MAG: hypothetical protein RLY16_2746 [Bacteroidota bacterium]
MKSTPILALFASLTLVFSCKKAPTPAANADAYMNVSPNSSWNYRETNLATTTITNYTITSTSRDTVINSRSYHIFNNSNGNKAQYYLISGNEYYEFREIVNNSGGNKAELLYLKNNVSAGTTWQQNLTMNVSGLDVPVSIAYTLAETNGTRTVNGTTYNNVIKVNATISSSLVPAAQLTSDIQNYYAPGVGNIESTYKIDLDYSGITSHIDTKTILLSSDIR